MSTYELVPIGSRVRVSDQHYTGPAVILEYDPRVVPDDVMGLG